VNLRDKRVLVTGGAGFIGSHLVERLLAEEEVAEAVVLDNMVNGNPENLAAVEGDPRFVLIRGDVLDLGTVEAACRGVQVVFHLACLGVRHSLHAPAENDRVNAEGTMNLLRAAAAADVDRFVYVSSSEVFGTARYAPMDEFHPTWPETVYGASKLAGEAYTRAFFRTHHFPTVIVRPFNTYGPRSHFEGDSGEVIPRTIVRVLCGRSPIVFGDGEQTRDFLHVTDTVRALTGLVRQDAAVGGTVNVGYGAEVTINELCRMIAQAAGRTDLRAVRQDERPGDVRRLWVDPSQAKRLIDFRPRVSLDQGLAELVAWFRRRPGGPDAMLALVVERNWDAV